ncbi:MAG: META domain-containing protein [Paracoccaceae bacterium]
MLSRPILASLIILSVGPAPALARDVSGTAQLLERMILPNGSSLTVEVLWPDGRQQDQSEPLTVPSQPFRLTIADEPGLLRAMIRTPAGQRWLSAPIHLPAGDRDINLGDVLLRAQAPLGFSSWLACGPALVQIGYAGHDALIQRGDTLAALKPVSDDTGREFSDGRTPATTLHSTDTKIVLTWAGEALPPCSAFPDPSRAPVTLRGSDPAWRATLSPTGADYSMPDGTAGRSVPLVPQAVGDTVVWHSPGLPTFVLAPGLCRDAETGLPHPATARLGTDPPLSGCGGDPMTLLQGTWLLDRMQDQPTPAGLTATLTVDGDRYSGHSGCNRFSGTLAQAGAELRFGLPLSTRMACPPDHMAFEARFLDLLGKSAGFELSNDSRLTLIADGDRLLELSRP